MEKNRCLAQKEGTERSQRQVIRIDVLPDDVLLEIFDFYLVLSPGYDKTAIEAWKLLVCVCRRWRSLVLVSPRRLNLRLFFTSETSIRDTLDVWAALPLVVDSKGALDLSETDNLTAALGQSNRVCKVNLCFAEDWPLEKVLAAMQVPFPELTDLQLSSTVRTRPAIPDSFLGGSAPRLRHFILHRIPFPGLPELLSTATHLVELKLSNIPLSGYISPTAMAALLSALSSLRILSLQFKSSPASGGESQSLPKRSILPVLDKFCFDGGTEYLEDLVTRIDTPQLHELRITLVDQIVFDCPQLAQFINRSPTLRAHDRAHVQFNDHMTSVKLLALSRILTIEIWSKEPDEQFSFIRQICNSSLDPLSTVEVLYIADILSLPDWDNNAFENTLWLQLLLPFSAVKNLYVSEEYAPGIAAALQELARGTATGVLSSLQNIFVEGLEPSGPLRKKIQQFAAVRQLSDHPIAISVWEKTIFSMVWV